MSGPLQVAMTGPIDDYHDEADHLQYSSDLGWSMRHALSRPLPERDELA